jgi:hypothetical protein
MYLPIWLVWLSIASLAVALASAAYLLYDIVVHKRRMMAVMKWVWPLTALYMGPVAIWAYRTMGLSGMRHGGGHGGQQHQGSGHQGGGGQHHQGDHQDSGRQRQGGHQQVDHGAERSGGSGQPFWQIVFKGVTHCGGGCTLGDLIGEWGIFISAATLAGIALWPEYIADYLLAYVLGIAFQYFAIAPLRGLGLKDGLIAAVKADTLALTAFEIGLFGWMALFSIVFFGHHLHPDSPVYWFMMQIGMVIGFATSYPMNWWLIRTGLKEAM